MGEKLVMMAVEGPQENPSLGGGEVDLVLKWSLCSVDEMARIMIVRGSEAILSQSQRAVGEGTPRQGLPELRKV